MSPLFTSTSHATRLRGSCVRCASRIESAMKSQTLSGCPSLTDSDVNTYDVVVSCPKGACREPDGAIAVIQPAPVDGDEKKNGPDWFVARPLHQPRLRRVSRPREGGP